VIGIFSVFAKDSVKRGHAERRRRRKILTIKQVVLSASLLVAGNAIAQDKTYTVKDGDTLSEIASKFGVKTKAVLSANNLASADKLKLGQQLRIPAASPESKAPVAHASNLYTIREGDNDVVIAKRLGVTPKALRVANMGTKWTNLRPGQTLKIPGADMGWFATLARRTPSATVAKNTPKPATPAKKAATPAKSTVVAKSYKVREGDNDWIIAKKVGTKPSVLRQLNPSVNWDSLQIGKVVRIPGVTSTTQVVASNSTSKVKKIRSRYAVITGDAVTLRRGPSTNSGVVTRVDKGTRVTVLDNEGPWYKLRFPRGTEAWVRGDLLASTAAPVVASNARKSKSSSKRTVVASNEPTRASSRSSRTRRNSSSSAKTARSSGKVANVETGGNGLLEKAKTYLGVRYRYGAASRSATDCSGFTSQVYRSQGINLPRTAKEQSTRGAAVAKSNLKKGDLVFFKTNRGTRINHVGIYIGDGKFMHASSGGGRVMVSSLNEGYYQKRYAGGKRVANFSSSKKKEEPKKEVKKEEPKKEAVEAPKDPTPAKTGDGEN